jgi:hypothetical protein
MMKNLQLALRAAWVEFASRLPLSPRKRLLERRLRGACGGWRWAKANPTELRQV